MSMIIRDIHFTIMRFQECLEIIALPVKFRLVEKMIFDLTSKTSLNVFHLIWTMEVLYFDFARINIARPLNTLEKINRKTFLPESANAVKLQ